ncbi:protein grainyhead isoform X2 [Plodia interpunctella]|uniref:protein grainyhead isoform X2 n=1 Tax=Plodia interpunctella TaxID=58824 RepID=UPI002368925B|nr:protein grainyhead isoform X2 [Plodia interpunctella]
MSASPPSEERARTPRSPPRSPAPAHAVLATMTPVQPAHDYYPHKVEMDSDDGYPPDPHSYRHSPHELAAYAPDNKVPVQPDVYDQGMESIDEKTPIDLIYADDKQTVIYTTTPDQKRVEMISEQLDDGQLVSGGGQLVDGVSVVVGPPGQAVVVIADHVVDELGQVIPIPRRRKEAMEVGGEWRAYYSSGAEHPLSAATSAVLGVADDQPQALEYYKLPPLAQDTHLSLHKENAKLIDVWPAGGALKAANGAHGAELSELSGLLHAGLVKREPEDLSRKVVDEPEPHALKPPRHKVAVGEPGEAASPSPVPSRASSAGSLLPDATMYAAQMFAPPGTPSPTPYGDQYSRQPASFTGETYYREYYVGDGYQQRAAPPYGEAESAPTSAFGERYAAPRYHSKSVIAAAGLTVDLPSPDSGIGADAVTPRDHTAVQQPGTAEDGRGTPSAHHSPAQPPRTRPWHDFGRQNDADKIQIAKLFSPYGFKYHLETASSSSQRREDDRITYINKGQFYGITLDYTHDPDKPLKNQTVKSVVMLMFREEKSPEDEIKAWQFWHGRQHSVKQRILDADTKNSIGLAGCIEEVAHNAIAVYWNPLESAAKINIAVQCLSTDFSSQKGVKGLPLHIQIDTFEDPRDTQVYHRGYCQIKVFCDKGAERKTRDEERRAAKRKMSATNRKKLDEIYHPVTERSEFYSMADLTKPPVLFSPAEDIDKLAGMDIQGFYGHDEAALAEAHLKGASPFLLHAAKPQAPALKFHNHFPPDAPAYRSDVGGLSPYSDRKDSLELESVMGKRARTGTPPLSERVMLYVRQDTDDVYTPLHVAPPTTQGLLNAIENKYKISSSAINNLYRKNKKGITAKIDDEMLAYYCNEDLFLLEVRPAGAADDEPLYDITFVELPLDH